MGASNIKAWNMLESIYVQVGLVHMLKNRPVLMYFIFILRY